MNKPPRYGSIIPCPLCAGKNYAVLYPSTLTKDDFSQSVITENVKNSLDDYTKHAQIVRCTNCSLVYTNPMENMTQIMKGYADVVDDDYLKTEKFRKLLLKEHLDIVEQFKKSGKILDVGCFAGYFLELANERGWKSFGIEPSVWASKEAKKRGVTIIGKTIEGTKLPPETYDVITLWDVIEHLPNPHEVMTILGKSIKKGGYIAMGTPNIASLFAKVLGAKCPFLIRMHLILYSPRTLERLCKEHGFRVVYIGSYARVFPISYILDRIQIKNKPLQKIKRGFAQLPVIGDIPIKLRLGDSFVMVAQKV
jgi:2-polyprenyl-3-methyl-5-hydroxy-6-metoxy-1,4-benzoquinol methylase